MSEGKVKTSASAAPRRGLERHFEGWQLGVLTLALALVGVVFGVPRPVPPSVLPLPRLDPGAISRVMAEDEARANRVHSAPLSYDVRLIGEAFRNHGAAVALGDRDAADRKLRELVGRAQSVLKEQGPDVLLDLRAVQTQLFMEELERFETTGTVSVDLQELGDTFVDKARTSGWVVDGRLEATRAERFVLFRIRYNELLRLRDERAFAPSAEEWRIYYRFFMEHPAGEGSAAWEQQLGLIGAVERVDLDYPASFARGVLLYRLGRHAAAEQAFRAHLTQHPRGPWRLLARNHLAATVERVREATGPVL